MSQCRVCGSSAVAVRARPDRPSVLPVCVHHIAVCWEHLEDPCKICDGGEEEDGQAG